MKGRDGMKHDQCGEGHWGYSVETRGGAGSSGQREPSEEHVCFLRARIMVVWTWLEMSR